MSERELIMDEFEKVLNSDKEVSYKEITSLLYLVKCNNIDVVDVYNRLLCCNNTCNSMLDYIDYCSSEYKYLIYDNVDNILKLKDIRLFKLKSLCKDNQDLCNKISKKIESSPRKYIIDLIKEKYFNYLSNSEKNRIKDSNEFNTILDVVYLIIEDIARNEKVPLSSFSIVGGGSYSAVFGLGDKIIKIGKDRGVKSFNNNPYVVSTLLRKSFPINDKLSLVIEVNEKVDTKSYVSDEEMYQLYKKLRDIGLVWTDIYKGNVGRLLKDNVIDWRFDLKPSDKVLGLDKYRGTEILRKGDIVILDCDYIFDENNIPKEITSDFRYAEGLFAERYEKEKKASKRR